MERYQRRSSERLSVLLLLLLLLLLLPLVLQLFGSSKVRGECTLQLSPFVCLSLHRQLAAPLQCSKRLVGAACSTCIACIFRGCMHCICYTHPP